MGLEGFAGKAEWFDHHYLTGRGRVRLDLVLGRLRRALPPPPADVLDAGGGTGAFAVPLAAEGYRVTVLDASPEWLDVASQRADEAGLALDLVPGKVEEAPDVLDGPFGAVLCHAVLAYVADPLRALTALRSVARPGAVLSSLEKNRDALPIRPAVEGRYGEARRLLDEPYAAGRLGIVNRAFRHGELRSLHLRSGWRPESWAGVRAYSDHAPEDLDEETVRAALDLERAAAAREPHRRRGRLLHLLARADLGREMPLDEVQAASFRQAGAGTLESWPEGRSLTAEELAAFLDQVRYGVLSTTRPSGRPHAAMVGFCVREGRFWLPAVAGAARLRNLEGEPTASLMISRGEGDDHVAVVVEGDALVHADPGAVPASFLFEAWKARFGTDLGWAGAIVELLPTRVLSYGRGRVLS